MLLQKPGKPQSLPEVSSAMVCGVLGDIVPLDSKSAWSWLHSILLVLRRSYGHSLFSHTVIFGTRCRLFS